MEFVTDGSSGYMPNADEGFVMILNPMLTAAAKGRGKRQRAEVKWVPDELVSNCTLCRNPFTLTNRKHHCRVCGNIFCGPCSPHFVALPPAALRSLPQEQRQGWGAVAASLSYHLALLPSPSPSPPTPTATPTATPATPQQAPTGTGTGTGMVVRMCTLCFRQKTTCVRFANGEWQALAFEWLGYEDLHTVRRVCRTWSHAGMAVLSSRRTLLHLIPGSTLTADDRAELWDQRRSFCGHNRWLVQLIHAIDWDWDGDGNVGSEESRRRKKEKADELLNHLVVGPRTVRCEALLCSARCSTTITPLQAAELLLTPDLVRHGHGGGDLVRRAVDWLRPIGDEDLLCVMPNLVYLFRVYSYPSLCGTLRPFLLERAAASPRVLNDYYWTLRLYQVDGRVYTEALAELMRDPREELRFGMQQLQRATHLTSILHRAADAARCASAFASASASASTSASAARHENEHDQPSSPEQKERERANEEITRDAVQGAVGSFTMDLSSVFLSGTAPLLCPINPLHEVIGVHTAKVSVKRSAARPVEIPFIRVGASTGTITGTGIGTGIGTGGRGGGPGASVGGDPLNLYRVLIKHEDLRRDQVVVNLIRLAAGILKAELGTDFGIVTYRVLPLELDCKKRQVQAHGMIEMVPDSLTLAAMEEQGKTIQNFLLEQEDLKGRVGCRQRFLESAAAYTVLTYLLGVTDRHKDNIMVDGSGRFFHIDFGYVLRHMPAMPLFQMEVRITDEMIDALGGRGSERHQLFQRECGRIYLCLRRHTGLFLRLLLLLAHIEGGAGASSSSSSSSSPMAATSPLAPPLAAAQASSSSSSSSATASSSSTGLLDPSSSSSNYHTHGNSIFTEEHIRSQVLQRFAPDRTDAEAEHQFLVGVERSAPHTLHYVADMLHKHARFEF